MTPPSVTNALVTLPLHSAENDVEGSNMDAATSPTILRMYGGMFTSPSILRFGGHADALPISIMATLRRHTLPSHCRHTNSPRSCPPRWSPCRRTAWLREESRTND